MATVRGCCANPTKILGMASLCLSLLVHLHVVESAEYEVGDTRGWSFNVVHWPDNKTFHEGDVLVFNYNPQFHNVVAIDGNAYNSCIAPADSPVYHSGSDRISLIKGDHYFMCGFPTHCEGDMKIAVHAV